MSTELTQERIGIALPRAARELSPAGYVTLIAAVAALGGLLFGFDTAIINGALVFLRKDFALNDFQTEVAASSILVGCIFGASFAGSLCDRFGRKRMLIGAAGLFLLSALGAAIPRTLEQFTLARLVGGLAIGVVSMLAPLYIAEVSPARIRGRLVTLNQMAIVTGILCAYIVSWFLASRGVASWRWMFASAAAPSLLFLLALWFVPESPRWLIQKGRATEALEVLTRLSNSEAARAEVGSIRATIAMESGTWRQLLAPRLRLPLLIGVTLAILQQVTGINTILYYGSILFTEHSSHSAASAIGANAIVGAINFIGTIVALVVIDRIGRKKLLLVTSAGMAVALGLLGLAFRDPSTPGTWILGLILAYVACFAIGLGPAVWVLMAELFPNHIRGRAMSVATISLWVACFGISFTFLSLVKAIGASGAFWAYGAMCVFTVLFVWRRVPETKGKTLEEIEKSWK